MVIIEDTRQQLKHHKVKEKWFEDHGIKVIRSKLLVGDYTLPTNQKISIDTKKDVNELYQDLISDHTRFRNECILAQELGIRLIILVENRDGITHAKELGKWKNEAQWKKYFAKKKIAEKNGYKEPKPPVTPSHLIKMMYTMNRKYGVDFRFCKPEESAQIIVALLGGDANG